jgi:hypothetical protein
MGRGVSLLVLLVGASLQASCFDSEGAISARQLVAAADPCATTQIADVWVYGTPYADCPNRVHMVYTDYGTPKNEIDETCLFPAPTGVIKYAEAKAAEFSCVDDYSQLEGPTETFDGSVIPPICHFRYSCAKSTP